MGVLLANYPCNKTDSIGQGERDRPSTKPCEFEKIDLQLTTRLKNKIQKKTVINQ
jgi:hypothetical protein